MDLADSSLKKVRAASSRQLSDSGVMVFKGRSYSSDQMQGRSAAMIAAARFLQSQAQHLSEAQTLAADLMSEADEWAKRAKRSCDALTPGQRRTYEHLQAYMARHDRSPTMVELAELEQVSSTTIHRRIRSLINKGFVCKAPNVHGGLSTSNAPRGGEPGLRSP